MQFSLFLSFKPHKLNEMGTIVLAIAALLVSNGISKRETLRSAPLNSYTPASLKLPPGKKKERKKGGRPDLSLPFSLNGGLILM